MQGKCMKECHTAKMCFLCKWHCANYYYLLMSQTNIFSIARLLLRKSEFLMELLAA